MHVALIVLQRDAVHPQALRDSVSCGVDDDERVRVTFPDGGTPVVRHPAHRHLRPPAGRGPRRGGAPRQAYGPRPGALLPSGTPVGYIPRSIQPPRVPRAE